MQDPTALRIGGGSRRIFQELIRDLRDLTVDDVRGQLGEFPGPLFVDELSARVEGAPCTGLSCYRSGGVEDLTGEAREQFRSELSADEATWTRARGWAISQAVVAIAFYTPW